MATVTRTIYNMENENTISVTYDTEAAESLARQMRDGDYRKSAGGRVFSTENNMRKFAARFSSKGSEILHATAAQVKYMIALRIQIPTGCTLERASQLIDAAKSGILGSVNGFYTDGSN